MKIQGTIKTISEFNKLIEEIRNRRGLTQGFGLPHRQEYFRGQVSSTWTIKPGLVRNLKSPQQAIEAEKALLDLFKQEINSKGSLSKIYLHKNPRGHQNDWAWLMQAQHYGIPTRLLDWSLKPEVALYFAIDNSAFDNEDGQFLVIFYPSAEIRTENHSDNQYYDIDPVVITNTWFMNPSFFAERDYDQTNAETRRARQHGKFSIQPFEDALIGLDEQPISTKTWYETFDPVIEKYIIPADCKLQIRSELKINGWDGEFLYANDDPMINEIRDQCKTLLSDLAQKFNY